MANTKIVLNRQSDLILDNALITNPQGIVLTDISGVSEAVASINTSTSADLSAVASIANAQLSYEVWKGTQELNGAFSIATSARVSGDLSLSTDLSTEVSRAESSEYSIKDGLSQVLNTESSNRVSSDLSLQNQINFITNNSDAAAIDSLTEVVAAFQSADGDLNGAITNLANAATVDLSAEISNRVSGDESLTSDLSAEISERQQGINELYDTFSGDLSAEISNRIADVDAELSRAESAEASLDVAKLNLAGGTMSGGIDMGGNNITNANAFIGHGVQIDTLYGNANTVMFGVEALDFQNTNKVINLPAPTNDGDATNKLYVDTADLSIAANLSAEVSRAESAELSIVDMLGADLTADLSTEASDRLLGDEYLQSQLNDLAQTDGLTLDVDTSNNTIKLKDTVAAPLAGIRTFEGLINVGSQPSNDGAFGDLSLVTKKFVEDADASIMSIVNNVITNIDPSALDSLTEIVAAFQSADNDLNGTITNLSNAATTDLNTEVDARISSITSIDDMIDALPLTDGQTIDVNIVDNTIELKETVAAPDSGIRTFLGEVDVETILKVAGVDVMATLSSEVSRAESSELSIVDMLGTSLSTELSSEVSRAESAEASIAEELSSEVSYIIANTDLSSIDSFAEVVADLSSEVSRAESAELSLATNFTNIYAKHVAVTETPNGSVTSFTLASPVREGSELIYLNGLSLDSEDYTANVTSGMVVGVTFITAPSTGDKVRAYGVY